MRHRVPERIERALEGVRIGRRGDVQAIEQNAGKRAPEHLHSAEACGAHRFSMKRVGERNHPRPLRRPVLLRELHTELDRHLDGGRAIVAEKDAVQTTRCDGTELLGEHRRWFVRDPRE
jgi:hypothetical protein